WDLARCRFKPGDGFDPFRACIARYQLRLALEELAVERTLLRGVARPVLLDNVVGSRALIVAAQLGGLPAAGLRTPRRTWSSSIDSNRARKLPLPKPSSPFLWIISKKIVPIIVLVKICRRKPPAGLPS